MGKRKLFCQICPLTYKISVLKCKLIRNVQNLFFKGTFAKEQQEQPLPVVICEHKSLIRRRLGNVDMHLQENKARNLSLVAPKISGIIINPGETFSFWRLAGCCTKRKGFREGLLISDGATKKGVGGGMCQFTNLIHWLVLHTPMEITEHHHHDGFDLFPDFGRQVPFGVGTSIKHNYLDYRFKNTTDMPVQLIVYVDGEYLHGELRSLKPLPVKYHVRVEDEHFSKEEDGYYRINKIYRECVDKVSGKVIDRRLIKENHAKVMYDPKFIEI